MNTVTGMPYLGSLPGGPAEQAGQPKQNPTWSPYDNNGGSIVAVAGKEFVIIASDSRLSTGYSILTRKHTKILKMNDKVILGSSGFAGDMHALHKLLTARHVMYQHNHGRSMTLKSASQLLQNTLYYKRFFPYYTFNVLAGIDEQGRGVVYNYDAVGCVGRCWHYCSGSGAELMQPLLDTLCKVENVLLGDQKGEEKDWGVQVSEEVALETVKCAFVSAGERDIYTGDEVEIWVINKSGTRKEKLSLKKD